MAHVEAPSRLLPAAVLAHEPVQPALNPPGKPEIRRIEREHQPLVHHAGKEPVGQNEFDAVRTSPGLDILLPLVDPGEAVYPLSSIRTFSLAQRRGDGGGLQPVQRSAQRQVVAAAGATLRKAQDLVGRGHHQARRRNAFLLGLDDLARSPDQHVGIPDGGDAVLGHALDRERNSARFKSDRHNARRFGEREERIGHQVLRIAQRHVAARQRAEQRQLLAFARAL